MNFTGEGGERKPQTADIFVEAVTLDELKAAAPHSDGNPRGGKHGAQGDGNPVD